jgi:hypothetical protein
VQKAYSNACKTACGIPGSAKPSAAIDPAQHAPVQDTTGAIRENSIMETLLNPEAAPNILHRFSAAETEKEKGAIECPK